MLLTATLGVALVAGEALHRAGVLHCGTALSWMGSPDLVSFAAALGAVAKLVRGAERRDGTCAAAAAFVFFHVASGTLADVVGWALNATVLQAVGLEVGLCRFGCLGALFVLLLEACRERGAGRFAVLPWAVLAAYAFAAPEYTLLLLCAYAVHALVSVSVFSILCEPLATQYADGFFLSCLPAGWYDCMYGASVPESVSLVQQDPASYEMDYGRV